MRELDEVRGGPEWRRGQDVRRVAEVQVRQRARQVARGRRGPDAVIVPLFVPAEPAAGAHVAIAQSQKRRDCILEKVTGQTLHALGRKALKK